MAKITNEYKGLKGSQKVDEEWQLFRLCEQCGQIVDRRELGQIMHHSLACHEPLDDDEMTTPLDKLREFEAMLQQRGASTP